MKKTNILKKWWVWIIAVVVVVGITSSIWYTQSYTSEWGKGLSKEEKEVFEYAQKTNAKSFDIVELTNKEIDILYKDMKQSGIFTDSMKNNLKEINNQPDDVMYVATKLSYVFDDFIDYKKELAKDVTLSEKAKKIMPFQMNEKGN